MAVLTSKAPVCHFLLIEKSIESIHLRYELGNNEEKHNLSRFIGLFVTDTS